MADPNIHEGFIDKTKASKPFLKQNILHKFATYNTIFTLSGISEEELMSHKFLSNPVHDIIARSGGIGDARVSNRSFLDTQGADPEFDATLTQRKNKFYNDYSDSIGILARAHDLFIENVNMISTVGPNAERNLGNFTKMEFEIHEPFGVTFIEKVRAATAINGFIDYQDAPLLLTIEFVGGGENGQAGYRPFSFNEPIKSAEDVSQIVRKIPILISRVDFDVNEAGARYSMVAVPYTDLAFDDRYKYPRTGMPIEGDDALEWTKNAEIVLQDMMQDEIDEKVRTFPDIYRFEIDQEVIDRGGKYKNANQSSHSGGAVSSQDDFYDQDVEAGTQPKPKKASAQASQGIAITKWFEDAIRGSYGYQQLANDFWLTYLNASGVKDVKFDSSAAASAYFKSKDFEKTLLNNQYVDWFKIKTTVETPDPQKIDPITKMSPKIIRYRAIPYKIHVLKFIAPGISLANVDWSQYVHKEYNYIYTGDNLDVQGLRINYKSAYYVRNVRGDDRSRAEKGIWNDISETFKTVFGKEKAPEPLLPLRQYPSSIKGANTLQTLSGEANKAQQFYDYLTNPDMDMMRIELEILGDPTYICQDMYVPLHEDGKNSARVTKFGNKDEIYDNKSNSFNADQFQPIINVRYRLPDDIDEKQGTMFSGDRMFRDERLFFNGLYQVNKIESSFNNGEFKQTLFCNRFNNQQGAGVPADLANASVKSLVKLDKEININDAKKKIRDKINDEFIRNERQDDADGNVPGV